MGKMANLGEFLKHKGIYLLLHLAVLVLSVLLIIFISVDTFHGIDFYYQSKFMHFQVWICMAFILDFFIELFMSHNKWHYFKSRFIFLIVSIPYQVLLMHYRIQLPEEVLYVIRYMPLIRGGYALAIVVGWLTYNKVAGLFFTYIIILFSTVYFASLTFYLFEHPVNPGVTNYKDALWWAAMDVTTVGSNISAMTGVGRVLSVVLAAMGMMMFPIFTVYVTNLVTRHNQEGSSGENILLIPKKVYSKKNKQENTTENKTPSSGS